MNLNKKLKKLKQQMVVSEVKKERKPRRIKANLGEEIEPSRLEVLQTTMNKKYAETEKMAKDFAYLNEVELRFAIFSIFMDLIFFNKELVNLLIEKEKE